MTSKATSRVIKFRAYGTKTKMMFGSEHLGHWSIGRIEKGDTDEFIFMQFTGLLDKNGKEIWEGDVAKCQYCERHKLEVFYDTRISAFALKSVGGEPCANKHLIKIDNWLEVIGNVFEHGYLLENESKK